MIKILLIESIKILVSNKRFHLLFEHDFFLSQSSFLVQFMSDVSHVHYIHITF